MNPKAVIKARGRLRIAQAQLEAAEHAESYTAFGDAWYLFLIAAKNVYTIIEKGAKESAQSRQWFGAKKHERKSDPLLQYLFQARDDDEHGLQEVTRLEPGSLKVGVSAPGYSTSMSMDGFHIDEHGKVHLGAITAHDNLPVLITQTPSRAHLIPVTARGGKTYEPPLSHLGQTLVDVSPISVGRLGLAYLETLISDAEDRAS